MIDLLEAMIEIFKTDTGIIELVVDRVYGESVPREEIPNQPRPCIIIRSARGRERTGTGTTFNRRFDVWSIAASDYEAARIDRVMYDAVKVISRRTTLSKCLVHSAGLSGGPTFLNNPDTGWPCVVRSINVTADEQNIRED
jgi:hypothetical protein